MGVANFILGFDFLLPIFVLTIYIYNINSTYPLKPLKSENLFYTAKYNKLDLK